MKQVWKLLQTLFSFVYSRLHCSLQFDLEILLHSIKLYCNYLALIIIKSDEYSAVSLKIQRISDNFWKLFLLLLFSDDDVIQFTLQSKTHTVFS